jgi:MOSC domain-containing protein YiiM
VGYLQSGYGLVGDAHAGRGEKEVSILLAQYVAPVIKRLDIKPEPGSFAENLLVHGLDEADIMVGTVLQIGEALVKVEMIGKEPSPNHTYSFHGFSLLAERGIFCRVLKSGWVKVRDPVTIDNSSL